MLLEDPCVERHAIATLLTEEFGVEFLRCYELLWILGEIAEYVARFAHPHPGNAEDAEKWNELLLYLTAP